MKKVHIIEDASLYVIKVIIIHSELYPEDHSSLCVVQNQKKFAKEENKRKLNQKPILWMNAVSYEIFCHVSQNGIHQVCWKSALWCNFSWLDRMFVFSCQFLLAHMFVIRTLNIRTGCLGWFYCRFHVDSIPDKK